MISVANERVAVTMCGVDPMCLGGISTLTRTLSFELSRRSDVDFEYVTTANQGFPLRKLLCFLSGLVCARHRFMRVHGIVHIHMADNASVVRSCTLIRLAHQYEQVVVLHIHCDLLRIRERSSLRMQRMIDWSIAHADHIIVLGSYLDALFGELSYPDDRVTVLPNAVACPQENPYTLGRRSVLFLGNVSEAKGVLDFLDALSCIDDKLDADIKVDLCGKDHIDVEEEIVRRGLANRVRYRGVVTPDADFFSHYALNVLPSHHEAMPFALLEASASGVPTVATVVGSIPEVIDSGRSGWLVEPQNVNALAAVLLNVLSDSELLFKASDQTFRSIKRFYSLDAYVMRLLEVYRKVSAS